MKRYLFFTLFMIIFSTYVIVLASDTPNGFVVWAEGGDCERGLMFNKIEHGKLGEKKTAVEKHIADCWITISYDGVWIAFCRADSSFIGKYGNCDYHTFGIWDMYIAKIDSGKNLPATPIKVANGYLPSWGMDENAKTPGKPKTLYFTKYIDQTIQKTTINPDGTFTPPVEHSRSPQKGGG